MNSALYVTAVVGMCALVGIEGGQASPRHLENTSWRPDGLSATDKADIDEYLREMLFALTSLPKDQRRILMSSSGFLFKALKDNEQDVDVMEKLQNKRGYSFLRG